MRRNAILVILAAVLGATALAGAVAEAGYGHRGPSRESYRSAWPTTTETTAPPSTTSTTTQPPPGRTYPLTTTTLTLYDAGRGRTLTTYVTRPEAAGAFPLVVVGHGLGGNGAQAAQNTRWLAQMGYVTAAPSFPEASNGSTSGLQESPGDVSFVITSLLDPATGLAAAIDADRIGYFGTSYGGIVGMMFFNDAHVDARIKSIVVRMGTAPGSGGGNWVWNLGTPVLMIHGDQDQVVSFQSARQTYGSLGPPKAFITLHGRGHDVSGAPGAMTHDASLAWFDHYLKGDPGGIARMQAEVAAEPAASLEMTL